MLFAFGALTYAQHPEGVLEYQKRRSTMRFERLFFPREAAPRRSRRRPCRRRCQWLTPPPSCSFTACSKSFGGIQAVHSITFDVGPGESVGLVGPNGAGKTTLFNCVCGQLRPEEGDIFFDGMPLLGCPRTSVPAWGSAARIRGSRCSPT